MRFLWPEFLWLLLAVPALVGAYVWLLRRKKTAIRYASLGVVREALGPGAQVRRHIPPFVFLLALIGTIVAVARPTAVITLPSERRTIILAMDVSLSMRASDIQPTRLAAAQTAAKAFVRELPKDVRAGIVTFAGTALLVQPPTQNREDLIAAIDRFELQRHTAIGSGIIVSLATLFPDQGIDLEAAIFGSRWGRDGARRAQAERERKDERDRAAEKKPFTPVPPGSYTSAAIILLTDGRRTTGPDPLDAAKMAADRGVRVFTVGFGTAAGDTVPIDGMSIFMRFDEEPLKAIAHLTRGEYFHASSAADLHKVYESLNTKLALEKQDTEIGALLSALAALLAVVAAALSLRWSYRLA